MTGKPFSQEEQEFLQETRIQAENLAPLVSDAPPLPPETLERIRVRTLQKAGAVPEEAPSSAAKVPDAARRSTWWWAVAAAALLTVGGAVAISNSEAAMAAIQKIVRLVPGIGLRQTGDDTLVMVNPVEAESGDAKLTITGLLSDGKATQVKFVMAGIHFDKIDPGPESAGRYTPTLRLADGTVLESTAAALGAGGTFGGILWFPPLPSGTESLTLVLPEYLSQIPPFEVAIPVMEADSAGLADAKTGHWAQERLGVRVGVPYWAVRDDKITFALDTVAAASDRRVSEIGQIGWDSIMPVLTDDQGRTYPLLQDQSNLVNGSLEPWEATFQGPMADGASGMRLSIPAVRVTEQAEYKLKIPLAKLPMGKPLNLNQTVTLGSHTFTILSVTRTQQESFRFDLDLGPERNGVLLQEVNMELPRRLFGGRDGWGWGAELDQETEQFRSMEFHAKPRGRNLEVVFCQPVSLVRGQWEIQLPVER